MGPFGPILGCVGAEIVPVGGRQASGESFLCVIRALVGVGGRPFMTVSDGFFVRIGGVAR